MEKNTLSTAVTTQLLQNTFEDTLNFIVENWAEKDDFHLTLPEEGVDVEVAVLRSMCQQCAKINPCIEDTELFKDMSKFADLLEMEVGEIPLFDYIKYIKKIE
jgi:hypothetical protein